MANIFFEQRNDWRGFDRSTQLDKARFAFAIAAAVLVGLYIMLMTLVWR